MKFSTCTVAIVLFLAPIFAAPLAVQRRALTLRRYNDMSISAGKAGSAEQEAITVWTAGLDLSDLTKISKADLDILKVERENAEKAETEAFNPAISAASGGAAEDALQCGKIKNKVLKLTGLAQIRRISLAQAQAAGDDTSKIEEQLADSEKKLANNIKIDKASAGQDCTAVSFIGKTSV